MWDRKEPNNFLSREECVRANVNGRWNDADCTRKHAFACYYPGELQLNLLAQPWEGCNWLQPHCGLSAEPQLQ
jgi:hypothetical protein